MSRVAAAALAVVLAVALVGCGNGGAGSGSRRTITVLAASSLSTVLPSLAESFERDHPGVDVVLSFAASSTLAQQIRSGAPADVFLSASSAVMRLVVDSGDARDARVFTRNVAAIAVARGQQISSLNDLATPGVKVALCQKQVPCGVVAAEVLRKAGLAVTPVTLGLDVRSTLATVTSGEADAAIVYSTDVLTVRDGVTGVMIPAAQNASTAYEIATLEATEDRVVAEMLVKLLLSEQGQRALAAAGFTAP